MTQEQQDKLRRALYNAKFTTDADDEDPFVGVYFNDLLDVLHDFETEIYRDGWLAGEANLAKEYKRIQWIKWIPVEERLPEEGGEYLVSDGTDSMVDIWLCGIGWRDPDNNERVTHWMQKPVPPRKEE